MTEKPWQEKTLGEMSDAEMGKLIDALPRKQSMRDEMYIGIKFLHLLLEKHGKEAVIDCVERLQKEIREGTPLEAYDFLDKTDNFKDARGLVIDEMALLKKAGWKSFDLRHKKTRMTRRDFFETVGWSTLATYWGAKGALGSYDSVTHPSRNDKEQGPHEGWVGQANHSLEKFGSGPEGLVLSATVFSYVANLWSELKLEHAANAISEMAKRQSPPEPNAPSR